MSDLQAHLRHIREEVVPRRRATQHPLSDAYLVEIEQRAQPPLLIRGIEQLNAGFWHEQHETLEWLWRATDEPVRDVFKGIILAGVGAHHARRRNRHGALAKWSAALEYLHPYAEHRPYGIEIGVLLQHVQRYVEHLLNDEQPNWANVVAEVHHLYLPFEWRAAQPRTTLLLRHLDRAFAESEMALMRTVADIEDEEADWVPLPGTLPIRMLVQQAGEARLALARHLFEQRQASGMEPMPTSPFSALLHWLEEMQEQIRYRLGFASDASLTQREEGRTLEERSLTVAERDLHLAGRIAVIHHAWYEEHRSR